MAAQRRRYNWIQLIVALVLASYILGPISTAPVSAFSSMERLTASGSVTGGRSITIRVTLSGPAPSGGQLVLLSSSSSLIAAPPTMVVPGGAWTTTVQALTSATRTTTRVTITASSGFVTKSTDVIVKEPYLSSLSLQTVIRAGGEGKLTVRLSGIAPSGGIVVNLAAAPSGYLTLPSSVTIPASAAGKTLIFPAAMVVAEEAVTVTASYDGRSVSKPTVVRKMT